MTTRVYNRDELHVIGVDPGERWTGVAFLRGNPSGEAWAAEMGVIDGQDDRYRAIPMIEHLLSYGADVALERYQSRPVGYQEWSETTTVRMIGAIEYVIKSGGHPNKLHYVRPGKAKPDLEAMGILEEIEGIRDVADTQILNRRASRTVDWSHAYSAWRVIGRYLIGHEPEVLRRISLGDYDVIGRPRSHSTILDERDLWARSLWARREE